MNDTGQSVERRGEKCRKSKSVTENGFIDEQVVSFVRRVCGEVSPEVLRVLTLTSAGARRGHICLDLSASGESVGDWGENEDVKFDDPNRSAILLQACPAVGRPGDFRPFILDRTRLYTHKFFGYETNVAEGIVGLAKRTFSVRKQSEAVSRICDTFPLESRWSVFRRVAAWNALTRGFCMISGGPGTGKTTSAAKILSLLVELNPGLRIVPSAPTGKAAARLEEALGVGLSRDHPDDSPVVAVDRAVTLHRLLGAGGISVRFKHNRDNPIAADVVVVDEASMVDIPLMSHLLDALGSNSRLILLGDHNQLASVQAGALLADICSETALGGITARYTKRLGDRLGGPIPLCESESPLADCIVGFRDVYRFDEGIREVSDAVRSGDAEKAYRVCENKTHSSARFVDGHAPLTNKPVMEQITRGYETLSKATTPEQAFAAYSEFKVLCAVRKSAVGVDAVNRVIENRLFRKGLLNPHNQFYANRPILIQKNDHALGVFNGDIGIILPDDAANGELRAFFSSLKGGYRSIAPAHLPPHETAFALTVHKSQGSEFGDVIFLLPERDTPVLTRELVYTALTRARGSVTIAGARVLFEQAVNRPTRRASGLAGRLWGEESAGGVQMSLGI